MTHERTLLLTFAERSLGAETLVLSDGTLWSHAATLGTRFKGSEFCIDRACVENFVNVFTSGYPRKIPVDYEHASTTDDPEVRKLRAQGMVPKAGDVVELRGVFKPEDFTGDLKAAAEKLSAQAGRPLDDGRNYGLWMRWKPTQRALAAVKAGEYTELSIAFDSDLPNNVDGAGQGPGLWAVALLNTPFLDDMLPVAASRDPHQASGTRSDADHSPETPLMNQKLISLVAALRSKSVATEDDAITELTAHQAEVTELRTLVPFRDVISAEFSNEKDPAKIVGTIRELRTKVAQAEADALAAKTAGIKTTVDATIKQYENKIPTVEERTHWTENLTAELTAGTKVDDTKTVKILKARSVAANLTQRSVADVGGAGVDTETKLKARADELMNTNDEVKELARTKGRFAAFTRASELAESEFETANA